MNATTAKNLIETNKAAAISELLSAIEASIQNKASKGWNRVCVSDIVSEYNSPIIADVYNTLRTNGFTVNVMTHTVIWN